MTNQAGKGSKNRLKGNDLKKYGDSKFWKKKVECTCAEWCLMDQLPEDACCHGSECECKVREAKK